MVEAQHQEEEEEEVQLLLQVGVEVASSQVGVEVLVLVEVALFVPVQGLPQLGLVGAVVEGCQQREKTHQLHPSRGLKPQQAEAWKLEERVEQSLEEVVAWSQEGKEGERQLEALKVGLTMELKLEWAQSQTHHRWEEEEEEDPPAFVVEEEELLLVFEEEEEELLLV